MSDSIFQVEQALFDLSQSAGAPQGPIFILGAPRTGSTILYQSLVAAFELPYLANLTNTHFAQTPIVGLSLQASWPNAVSNRSRFGKVEGIMQPSEASAVMVHWFGGGHPSELVSASILPEREDHMRKTIAAAWALFGRPLVIKNAWNCFRVRWLAEAFPTAAFIWIRRDLNASAKSDLNARYVVQGDPNAWNSATPRSWDALKARPYWEQVVENQVEFSRAISDGLARLGTSRYVEVWHEDLVMSPARTLSAIGERLRVLSGRQPGLLLEVHSDGKSASVLAPHDSARIDDYIECERSRFAPHRYRSMSDTFQ